MDGKSVYFLCGKIGSGKTTIAREIRADSGAVIFNLDEIMAPLFGQTLGRERYVKNLAICRDFVYRIADQVLDSALPVVFDFGFWSRAERREAAERFSGRKRVFLYCPLDDEEQRKRVFNRNASTDKTYSFTEEQLRFLNAFFEEPDESEGITLIRR
jgi:predicted kinase